MSNLGMDFIFAEILPRLPAKSLIRFKCVSKSFNTLISSREFGLLYVRHHSLSSSLLVTHGPFRIACHDLDSTIIATFDWHKNSAKVIGSSNGLLCICAYNWEHQTENLLVLNPTTQICQDIRLPFNIKVCCSFGFAFDPESLDFKIVGFPYYEQSEGTTKTLTAVVYSLNTNSWTKIVTKMQGFTLETRHGEEGVLINNSLLHWMFWTRSARKYRIGCFDVNKSKWVADVLLPDYPIDESFISQFGVFGECLFVSVGNEVKSCHDVWVMKEYGVQDSWIKLFSIHFPNVLQQTVVPIAYRGGTSEVLIQDVYNSKVLWYNRNNGGISEPKFDGAPALWKKVHMCSRSLVDIPGGKLFGDATWVSS